MDPDLNSMDPDQQASEKPANQDPPFFHSNGKYRLITGNIQVNSIIIGEKCSTYNIRHDKGKNIEMVHLTVR